MLKASSTDENPALRPLLRARHLVLRRVAARKGRVTTGKCPMWRFMKILVRVELRVVETCNTAWAAVPRQTKRQIGLRR
jgi:hypothetical protein